MKITHLLLVVFVGSHAALAEGLSFSLGLVTMGVASLTGLKFFFGIKMFAPGVRHARNGNHQDPSNKLIPDTEDQKFEFAVNISLPVAPQQTQGVPLGNDLIKGSSTPTPGRVRRDAPGGVKLSKSFLAWLRSIDDQKCIHRFFCDLGTDQSRFGSLGQMTNILISMGGLPKDSWAQDMFDAGQDGRPCPKTCDEHELSKTVNYLERHLFAPPVPGADLDTKENEILT